MAEGEKQLLLAAVAELSASLRRMVKDGRENFKASGEDINDFVRSHGKDDLHGLLTLYPVQLYAKCFKDVGVESRKDLESLWNCHFHDEAIQDTVKEFLGAEDAYREVIEDLDEIMATHEERTALPVAAEGDCLQSDVTLTDAVSGDPISLFNLLQRCPYTLFVLRKHYV